MYCDFSVSTINQQYYLSIRGIPLNKEKEFKHFRSIVTSKAASDDIENMISFSRIYPRSVVYND